LIFGSSSRRNTFAVNSTSGQPDFHCPGEPAAISRAVHLARLADGYPSCRQCQFRDDTDGLSTRATRKIPAEAVPRTVGDFFSDRGADGRLHEGFDAPLAGRLAASFGVLLRDETTADRNPMVVVASDARGATQPHYAAVVEQLRWAGCDLIELGAAPCPALAWAVARLAAQGGLYLGNAGSQPHAATVRFFATAGRPRDGQTQIAPIARGVETPPDRPTRTWGTATRTAALADYQAQFAEAFHGLRPLRFMLHTTCRPSGQMVERLLADTACRVVLEASDASMPLDRIADPLGHFSVSLDADGCRLRLWNERGEPVSFDRLFLAVRASRSTTGPAVIDRNLDDSLIAQVRNLGFTVVPCGPTPGEIHAAMVDSAAALGADAAGRIWYGDSDGFAAPDALATLAILLAELSRSDRPTSQVLDAAASRP
jgi:phosphomannomutase